ncbi:hypothetical protein HW532_03520 [Kaustia mangrovi]|uniref:ATP-grasp domain-containing protein n=1 Tax=Kaustia mangrovi TaxID=2593653 RepID=A0A7S8HAV7_9HYPH|nr:hypothetical protein [Kaustia mangrovi]QPC41866.1 hypothetical protein HW532_03520 [Kaustia mangrovi]
MTKPPSPTSQNDTVLLLGNYRPSLAAIRALAADGRRLVLGLGANEPGIEWSRHVKDIWQHPRLDEGDGAAFLAALKAFLAQRNDIGTLLPVSDEMVLFVARHRGEIAPLARIASPAADIVLACADKVESLTLARTHGVATHPFAVVHDREELFYDAERIGYPLALRPLTPGLKLFGQKALILEDRAALETAFTAWPAEHACLLLQRFADGQRHNLYFAARKGELVACVESLILRTNAPDGTGTSVLERTVEPTPALVEETRRLTAALDYTGVGFTQFIVARDGRSSCFLEIDARMSANLAVPEQSGVPLTRLALALADGGTAPEAGEAFAYRRDRLYAWTFGDLSGLKRAMLDRKVSLAGALGLSARIAAAAIRADGHLTWSLRDPMPTVAMFAYGLFGITIPAQILQGSHLIDTTAGTL